MLNNLLIKTVNLSRNTKIIVQIFVDLILITFSFFLSLSIRLNNLNVILEFDNWLTLSLLIPITILMYSLCGFYQSVIRFISDKFFLTVSIGVFLSSISMYFYAELLEIFIPRSIPFIYFNFLFFFTIVSRYFFKYIFLNLYNSLRKYVAIYGAGETGRKLLNSLSESSEYYTRMFIDDDFNLANKKVNGLKVFQFEKSIVEMKKHKINLILLALPNIQSANRQKIINNLDKFNLAVKSISNEAKYINRKSDIANVNNISIYDILKRAEIPIKPNLMKKNIFQKIVLVTGCGGSIGSELCKQILDIEPKTLVYFDNSEFALYKIDNEIQSYIKLKNLKINIFPILGSVQDKSLLKTLFNNFNIQTIYHTAAYKHVPLVEKNIIEAIKNNIFATDTLSKLAVLKKVETFILISSDKAVRPTNYMGATKRVAELICQTLSKNQKNTVFSIVRFGNVIGSSGSVIPLFAKQIEEGGPVTLTHKNITRYFMSIKEAVGLVIQAGAMSENGDLFVLDMGRPKKILNLAKKMIRLYGKKPIINNTNYSISSETNSITIKITGLRPGEKIYEELLLNNKTFHTKHPRIFKAREKSISKNELFSFLNKLKKLCNNDDLKNIKIAFEKAPLDFNTSNNFSDATELNNLVIIDKK